MSRKLGSTTRPQFHTYVTEIERKDFVKWAVANYKKDSNIAKWYGDQLFGKAVQPIGNDGDTPFMIQGVEITVRK
jgi:hypothetical protein